MKVILIIMFCWGMIISSYAQNIAAYNRSINIRNAGMDIIGKSTFFDTGAGGGGRYGNNENLTHSFFPIDTANQLRVKFYSFSTEASYDYLTMYSGSGNNTSFITSVSGAGSFTIGTTYLSTAADGSLTFNFSSDGSVNESGWYAVISSCNYNRSALIFSDKNALCKDDYATLYAVPNCNAYDFQWQISQDSTTWVNLPNASNEAYYTQPSTASYYRFRSRLSQYDTLYSNAIYLTIDTTCYSQAGTQSSVNTCSGTYYDSGKGNGNYSNNEFRTKTFYPDNPTGKLLADFVNFEVDSLDSLSIYNGNSINAPLIGTYTGTVNIGSIASTALDGSLTFQFVTDSANTLAGWEANLSCYCNTSSIVTHAPIADICPSQGTTPLTGGSPIGGFYSGNGVINSTGSFSPNLAGTGTHALTYTYIDTSGCIGDTLLYIQVLAAAESIDTIAACSTYTWLDGNTYTSNNDTAIFILSGRAASGCDSIITLNLTINQSTTGLTVQNACNAYTWINGITYTNSTIATDTLTSSTGCDSIVTLNLTITPNNAQISLLGTILSTNTIGTNYQWFDCTNNTIIIGANGPTYMPIVNGDYAVIVTNNNCTDTSNCIDVTRLGVENKASLSLQNVYPIPTKDFLTIELAEYSDLIAVQVVDISSKVRLENNYYSTDKIILSVQHLPKGVYFVQLTSNNKQQTIKMIKE
ncbi:MAG: T9SS type A sorting domain-containing protein [Aureispira sp.]